MSLFKWSISIAPIATSAGSVYALWVTHDMSPRARVFLSCILGLSAIATAVSVLLVVPDLVGIIVTPPESIQKAIAEFKSLPQQTQATCILGMAAGSAAAAVFTYLEYPVSRPVILGFAVGLTIILVGAGADHGKYTVVPAPDLSNASRYEASLAACLTQAGMVQARTVKEYEKIRFSQPGYFYFGSRLWISAGTKKTPQVEECLNFWGTTPHEGP